MFTQLRSNRCLWGENVWTATPEVKTWRPKSRLGTEHDTKRHSNTKKESIRKTWGGITLAQISCNDNGGNCTDRQQHLYINCRRDSCGVPTVQWLWDGLHFSGRLWPQTAGLQQLGARIDQSGLVEAVLGFFHLPSLGWFKIPFAEILVESHLYQ